MITLLLALPLLLGQQIPPTCYHWCRSERASGGVSI